MQDPEELSWNAEKQRKVTEQQLNREEEMREDGLLPQLGDDDNEMVTQGGENVREVSWIWTVAGTVGTDEGLEDGKVCLSATTSRADFYFYFGEITALRIEWSKSWAQSRRWTEEVRLLEEEWRRLPLSYAHREQVWVRRAVDVPVSTIPAAEAEGMIAYAMKQAQVYRDMAERAEATRTEVKLSKGKKRTV
jgi:hypothetical protein